MRKTTNDFMSESSGAQEENNLISKLQRSEISLDANQTVTRFSLPPEMEKKYSKIDSGNKKDNMGRRKTINPG